MSGMTRREIKHAWEFAMRRADETKGEWVNQSWVMEAARLGKLYASLPMVVEHPLHPRQYRH